MSIRVRRKRAAGLVVAVALVASLVGLQIASAEDPPDAGPRIDAGTLSLHVNGSTNDDYWSYTEAIERQSIRTSRCTPTYSGSTYVTHVSEPSTSTVGFLDGYGVKSSGEGNAGKCAQVNTPDQKLGLFLANGSGEPLDGLYADSAELDIEAKFNAFINIALFKDGVQVDADPSADGLTLVEDCTSSGSDCGPDSADGDNFRIFVPTAGTVLFDEVHLWATSGSPGGGVVLEGGADAGTSDSTFHLVQPAEGILCPGDTVTEPTGTGTSSVEYLGTTGECKFYTLVYSRDEGTNERELAFITSGTASPGIFEVKVANWDPEPVANPVPLSETDPAGDDDDPTGEWCDGTAASPTMPVGESWCAISLASSTYGPDGDGAEGNPDWEPGYDGQLMQVTETWLLVGDAKLQR